MNSKVQFQRSKGRVGLEQEITEVTEKANSRWSCCSYKNRLKSHTPPCEKHCQCLENGSTPTPCRPQHLAPDGTTITRQRLENYCDGEYALKVASITLKHIPEYLHAFLKNEAQANYRNLEQEVMARLERSLDWDAATRRDQKWIDEALASGPEEPFSREKFATALKRGLPKAESQAG